ncbi:hypothetical protein G647_04399 [Cladophialophora carrionii CBS 160.54]|uniref:C2H2-type domain-containing protein n=1 Tax=Cladophialophora carrionii CBS 160.54 TaxID=1279043 RepID=V9DDQ1_9EURO|nr:uncharacterized protein G647_04399 [Cladophialophora carrionii CBS 160.54]ETI25029.1 hypothetical protein G647_04399 [Cladophialophora carrionii CBS 160.54]
MTPDSQAPFDGADHSSYRQSLVDVFGPSADLWIPTNTDTCKPGDAESLEVPKANFHVQSSSDFPYQYTFCGTGFDKKYVWKRHEQAVHAPSKVWVCEPSAFCAMGGNRHLYYGKCPVCFELLHVGHCRHRFQECWERPEKDRTYFRKDALIQHMHLIHHPFVTQNLYDGRDVDVPTA